MTEVVDKYFIFLGFSRLHVKLNDFFEWSLQFTCIISHN